MVQAHVARVAHHDCTSLSEADLVSAEDGRGFVLTNDARLAPGLEHIRHASACGVLTGADGSSSDSDKVFLEERSCMICDAETPAQKKFPSDSATPVMAAWGQGRQTAELTQGRPLSDTPRSSVRRCRGLEC
eukprot:368931-Rhodomonas_salina.3